MRSISVVLILFVLASCQYFETEKISADTFYEQELKTISWEEVDQFPAFALCQNISKKEASKTCFESTLISKIHAGITSKHFISQNSISDTLWVGISISNQGSISLKDIKMDSITALTFPKLKSWIQQSIDSIPLIAPGHKRGVPVTVSLQLPMVLKTN